MRRVFRCIAVLLVFMVGLFNPLMAMAEPEDNGDINVTEETNPDAAPPSEGTSGSGTEGATMTGERGSACVSDGTAEGRVAAAICIGGGKEVVDDSGQPLSLTEEDIRILGVFMSNYYIPLVTELGTGKSGSKEAGKIQQEAEKDLENILTQVLSLDPKLAKKIAPAVRTSIQQNSQALKIGVSKDIEGTAITEVPDGEANMAKFLYYVSGGFGLAGTGRVDEEAHWYPYSAPNVRGDDDRCKEDGEDKDKLQCKAARGELPYGHLFYESGGKKIPVFTFSLQGKEITPSVQALITAYSRVPLAKGYGLNFFDVERGDLGENEQDLNIATTNKIASLMGVKRDDLKTENSGELGPKVSEYSMLNQKMFVSPFGDITYAGHLHAKVVLPGAMNPHTWEYGSGSDWKAGTALNLANLPLLTKAVNGGTKEIGTSEALKDGKGTIKPKNYLVQGGKAYGWRPSGGGAKEAGLYPDRTKAFLTFASGVDPNKVETQNGEKTVEDLYRIVKDYNKDKDAGHTEFQETERLHSWTLSNITGKWTTHFFLPVSTGAIDDGYADNDIQVNGRMFLFDNLGIYQGQIPEKVSQDLGKVVSLFSNGNLKAEDSMAAPSAEAFNTGARMTGVNFKPDWKNSNSMVTVGLYVNYVFAGMDMPEMHANLGYRLNQSTLPKLSNVDIKSAMEPTPEEKTDQQLNDIRDWLWYILNPGAGFEYFKQWVTNKLSALLLGWHDDMVGTGGTGVLMGSVRYVGDAGYVSSPELNDIEWIDSLLKIYEDNIIFVVILFGVMMVVYLIAGMLTGVQALAGFIIFAIASTIPVNAINLAVFSANQITDTFYSNKFNYWALVQHQGYIAKIDKAATESEDYDSYLRSIYFKRVQGEDPTQGRKNVGGESIVLRWQSPKKMASLMMGKSFKEADEEGSHSLLLQGVVQKAFSGETYLEDPSSTYLYRSYTDLANYSRLIYRGVNGDQSAGFPAAKGFTPGVLGKYSDEIKASYGEAKTKYADDRTAGYTNPDRNGESDFNNAARVNLPGNSKIYADAVSQVKSVKDLKEGELLGIHPGAFKFSIPMFTMLKGDFLGKLGTETKGFKPASDAVFKGRGYRNEDYTGLAAYGLMSENPFYYFSWLLYDQGMSTEANSSEGYKKLVLGTGDKVNPDFFYNNKDKTGNGELKDFLDMRSLFTYTIPMLKAGNDVVVDWDKVYGVKLHTEVPMEVGLEDSIPDDAELKSKYWHNQNVLRLMNIYSPWVDLMYQSGYAHPEKIHHMGKMIKIEDPLNPASYPKDRPMIFSRSEMTDFGIERGDLTTVEKKILNIQENSHKRFIDLMNYHNFSDAVLNTAAAMNTTFEFNKEFSTAGLFGNVNLYPKNYELKSLTFDAYVRLILENNSDLRITEEQGDYYSEITQRTSILTPTLLILNDVVAQYVIPFLRMGIVLTLFLTSILLLVGAAIKVVENKVLSQIAQSVIKPLLIYLLATVVFAFIVGAMMGNGNRAVTGDPGFNISFGSPTGALALLLLLNVGLTLIYFKLFINGGKEVFLRGKAVFSNIASAGMATLGAAAAGLGAVTGIQSLREFGKRQTAKASSNIEQSQGTVRERMEKSVSVSGGAAAAAGAVAGGAVVAAKSARGLHDRNKARRSAKIERRMKKREDRNARRAEKLERKQAKENDKKGEVEETIESGSEKVNTNTGGTGGQTSGNGGQTSGSSESSGQRNESSGPESKPVENKSTGTSSTDR